MFFSCELDLLAQSPRTHLSFPLYLGRLSHRLAVPKPGPLSKGIWGVEKYRHTVTTLRVETSP
jgi:hypothetical protein